MKETSCLDLWLGNKAGGNALGGVLLEPVGELLLWHALDQEVRLFPEGWHVVVVGVLDGFKGGLDKVTHGGCGSTSGGVHILNTGVLKHTLGCTGGNETSSARSWDETHANGTALASNLKANKSEQGTDGRQHGERGESFRQPRKQYHLH